MAASSAVISTMFLLAAVVSGKPLTEAEQKDMLDRHNQKRCMADVPPLEWDAELAAGASSFADTDGTEHSPGSKLSSDNTVEYGENIHANCPTESPEKAVTWWEKEREEYTEANPFAASHYTAMVWKSSTKLGCGKGPAFGCNGKFVCRFLPPGNNPYPPGNYAANVIAPTITAEACPLAASDAGDDDKATDAGDDTAASSPSPASDAGDDGKAVMTKENCQCKVACAKYGASYTWCNTTDSCGGQPEDGAWDYCSPSRLYDETASPIMARSIPDMALPALAMFACALLAVGAVAVRWRAKPANHEQSRDLMDAVEEVEGVTALE